MKGFQICIDDKGYYAEGMTANLVEVEEIPNVADVRYLPAYKFDEDSNSLVLDEGKLEEIKTDSTNEVSKPTELERLEAVESAVAEMAEYIYGGGA